MEHHSGVSVLKKGIVFGIGVNDADYQVKRKEAVISPDGKKTYRDVWVCPAYRIWVNMLSRCYSQSVHKARPSYVNCTVCDVWLRFTAFKAWYDSNYVVGWELDKDILVYGNTVYGPSTCAFVPDYLNALLTNKKSSKGDFPMGVYYHKPNRKYIASCSFGNGVSKNLGSFDTPIEAHMAWLSGRCKHVLNLIDKFTYDADCNKDVITGLLNYINILKHHISNNTELQV